MLMRQGMPLFRYLLIPIFVITISSTSQSFAKKAAIVIDFDTKEVLFEVNANTKNYPASLTKIMTLYILFDRLEKKQITHKIAEDFLSENERNQVFELVSSLHNWYDSINLKDIEFDGVNFLRFFDTIEFHTHLMNEFINFFTIRNIIDDINPTKIIASEKFYEI